MTRKLVGIAVLAVLCSVLAVRGYQRYQEYLDQERQRAQSEIIAKVWNDETRGFDKLPHGDPDMKRAPTAYPRPASAWQSAEKAFYASLLDKGRFDILVVPFQVQDHAFARTLRSLMTAELAAALARTGRARIPDPYLVSRALGESERRYGEADVFGLANALGVKRIVLGYVGHDDHERMRLTLQYYDRADNETFDSRFASQPARTRAGMVASVRLKSRHFENVPYSDKHTPLDAYRDLLGAMLGFLGVDAPKSSSAPIAGALGDSPLPESPLAIATATRDPARDAYYFQLLAALTPARAERTRERFIEKSLLALAALSPDSPEYRALKTRALMYMGLRPAALDALGTPSTPEEKHLLAMLDGDLPALKAGLAAIPAGPKALLATLEENAVELAYELRSGQRAKPEALTALHLHGDVWRFLAARALMDPDLWAQQDNMTVKALLDHEFPLAGFTAEAMIRGAATVGDLQKLHTAFDLAVLDHVRRQIQAQAAKWCCEPIDARQPGALDYLDLISAIGTDNLMRRAEFFTKIQARPEASVRYLDGIESVYKDYPRLALDRAEAELDLSQNASGAEREGLQRSAYADAFNAWYWEQCQTLTGAYAISVIQHAGRQDFGPFDNLYADDYPYRSFYPPWQLAYNDAPWLRNARAALANSTFDFTPVRQLEWHLGEVMKQWGAFDAILASLHGRFIGNPQRTRYLAESSVRSNDVAAAEKYYRDAIRIEPSDQSLYAELGKLLFEQGQNGSSAATFSSYPGLKAPASVNQVNLSNYAYGAGSLFFWSGDLKNAIPLYQAAAQLDTGSESSITSALRLRLLNGDLAGALNGTLDRIRRYQSSYAYRDYFGMLHATGHSKEAWDGFAAVVRQSDDPQIWETALVGHEMKKASEAEIARWAEQEPMRSAGSLYPYAAMYLLRAGVMDRTPSQSLPQLVARLERPVWQLDTGYRNVVRETTDPATQVALGPDASDDATLARPLFSGPKTRVTSELVYFAEAYRDIRIRDFAAAKAELDDASRLYDFRNVSLGYILPYYAYAAAMSRDVSGVEKTLDKFPVQYQRFDYHLALAVIAGIGGKTDESLLHLKLALHRRPYTERRVVFSEYEYGELCDWLYEATHDGRYRDEALRWAKANERLTPWFGWSYAMEAELTRDAHARLRAEAMAHYLDPNSERLARRPPAEVQSAVRAFAARNPFLAPSRMPDPEHRV